MVQGRAPPEGVDRRVLEEEEDVVAVGGGGGGGIRRRLRLSLPCHALEEDALLPKPRPLVRDGVAGDVVHATRAWWRWALW